MPKPTRISRRRFIQAAAATSAWALGASSYNRVLGANSRLNVAFIGTSGIAAGQHIPPLAGLGVGCPCYCDADQNRFGPAFNRWPEAKGYTAMLGHYLLLKNEQFNALEHRIDNYLSNFELD